MSDRPYIVFGAPQITEAEIGAVSDVLRSRWLGTGPKAAEFERRVAEFTGARYAIAVNSCTAALHLALKASGVGEGDEVIVPTMTFCATANAVIHSKAVPVLVDCEPLTGNLDPEAVERAVTPRTKAVIPVHFAGRPVRMDDLTEICNRYNLTIIEDAAHAIEAQYKGRFCGNLGDMGCYSFYVTKNVITGEGGMVTTNHERQANWIKMLALHGMTRDAWGRYSDSGFKHYEVVAPGFKYNMMDIQAALGIEQLKRVEDNWRIRAGLWDRYRSELADLPLDLPPEPEPETRHAFHLFFVLLQTDRVNISRDEFMARLHDLGVGTGVHYRAVHLHHFYRSELGHQPEDFPVATDISERTVSLPFSPALTETEVGRVLGTVREVLEKAAR